MYVVDPEQRAKDLRGLAKRGYAFGASAARILGIPLSRVHDMCKTRRLECTLIGTRFRIDAKEIERYMQYGPRDPDNPKFGDYNA